MSKEMSTEVFERFVAGDDKLSALLRAVPLFEAPAEMATRFAALAHAAQTVHADMQQAAAPLMFEAPASLEMNFLAEAARAQTAQQPRHDAVISEIHAGKSAAEVLGHDVSQATAEWLASRPQRMAAQAALKPQRPPINKWWQRIGVLAASAFFGGVATNLWLAKQNNSAPIATAMHAAPADSAKPLPPSVTLVPLPIAQVTRKSVKPPEGKLMAAAPAAPAVAGLATPAAETMKMEVARQDMPPDVTDKSAAQALNKASVTKGKQLTELAAREQAIDMRRERTAVASAKLAQAAEMMTAAPIAAPRAAAPAPAPAPAAPAPARTKAATDRTSAQIRVELSSSPQDVLAAWQTISHDVAPRIFAAHPESDAVRIWVERFRQSLPPDTRPNQIKIEQDSQLREDVLRLVEP